MLNQECFVIRKNVVYSAKSRKHFHSNLMTATPVLSTFITSTKCSMYSRQAFGP